MKRILLIFTFCISITGISQSNRSLTDNFSKLPQENIYTHINNNFLLSGETLYYKLYCFDSNGNFSNYSKVAYVELINSDNISVSKQKVNLKKGNGNGDFFINTNIKTGTYKLISYTQWMLNKQIFSEKNILIVNPFSNKLNNIIKNENSLLISKPSIINSPNSLFKGLLPEYKTRQKITLEFTKKINFNSNISISVKQKNNLNLPLIINKGHQVISSNQTNKSNIYLPELRGTLIQGTVITKTEKYKVPNVLLSLSIKGEYNHLPKTALTNKRGEFYFNILDLYTDKVFIQILDDKKADYDIFLKKNIIRKPKFHNFPEITLDQNIIKIIKDRSIYSQIENAFFSVKKDSIIKVLKKAPLFNQIKKTYLLDEYKRFKTVKETFVEIIEGAGIIKQKDSYKISIRDSHALETLSDLPSLLIVDGSIVYDHSDLIDFNSKKIKSISVVRDKYYYGNAIYQGVVIVKTFKKDFLSNINDFRDFTVLPIQFQKKYFFQQHKKNNQRVPDYRTQLYWNPNLNLTKKQFSFYTSDVKGVFEIDIQGFSKNGKFILEKKTFTVN
ncbi:hypothetical protein H3Z83_01965 [Tenacibaculum sp. S7007]|uniref:TonB-dependent receptor plug domain-containing protein n=1 Tax=Tenacibaculum pelagium TaxID=2759527 RepID=A0A839AM79_9FLAO|nr:hypothetical protein [Tenacibaculum pelagium]MBA6155294.1 hypothetical protein [Tenacibaculum pelagium]